MRRRCEETAIHDSPHKRTWEGIFVFELELTNEWRGWLGWVGLWVKGKAIVLWVYV